MSVLTAGRLNGKVNLPSSVPESSANSWCRGKIGLGTLVILSCKAGIGVI